MTAIKITICVLLCVIVAVVYIVMFRDAIKSTPWYEYDQQRKRRMACPCGSGKKYKKCCLKEKP